MQYIQSFVYGNFLTCLFCLVQFSFTSFIYFFIAQYECLEDCVTISLYLARWQQRHVIRVVCRHSNRPAGMVYYGSSGREGRETLQSMNTNHSTLCVNNHRQTSQSQSFAFNIEWKDSSSPNHSPCGGSVITTQTCPLPWGKGRLLLAKRQKTFPCSPSW